MGLFGVVSVNVFGFVIGVFIGGYLVDKYGWKFIYMYNMLVYMFGVIIIMFVMNFLMLLIGFLVIGFFVGVGVLVLWIYIFEMVDFSIRVRNIGIF